MNTFSKNKTKQPLVVGLTGGIGSGKSTVAKIFSALQVPIFNADEEAKNIINNDPEVIRNITELFGEVYDDGVLNTEKIAQQVFIDKKLLEKLNQIVHPKVAERFSAWINANKERPMIMKEAAILIESGSYKEMDKIILVTAPDEERITRVMKRDNCSREKIIQRINNQFNESEKLKYADFIITNDGVQLVIPQVLEIYEQLKNQN